MKRAPAFAALSAVALIVGCRDKSLARDTLDDRHGETTITSARVPVPNETAMARLVAARCDRETECSNIGPSKHYADRDVCRHELSTALRSDLEAAKCPRGISSKELDECIVAIHKESCNNAFDTISRLAACRTSDLCLTSSDSNR